MLSEIISAHRHGTSARRPEASAATRRPEASASGSGPGSADQDGSERPKKNRKSPSLVTRMTEVRPHICH